MRENTDQKKLRIWTLFTQCIFFEVKRKIIFITNFTYLENSEPSHLRRKGNLTNRESYFFQDFVIRFRIF